MKQGEGEREGGREGGRRVRLVWRTGVVMRGWTRKRRRRWIGRKKG
jgi:hypothetical protein